MHGSMTDATSIERHLSRLLIQCLRCNSYHHWLSDNPTKDIDSRAIYRVSEYELLSKIIKLYLEIVDEPNMFN